jgi:tungstate transport system substrate-binding protein
MLSRRNLIAAVTLVAAVFATHAALAQDKSIVDKSIVVASTTSTQDSGLFEYLLPLYKKKTGVVVKVIAQGTGQALDTGRRGDAGLFNALCSSSYRSGLRGLRGQRRSDPGRWCRID